MQENQIHRGLAERLRVEHTLEGHEGCVNRVSWSDDGTLLSGSDDRKLIIWRNMDSLFRLNPMKIQTPHRSNIFGCKFLPCTNDTKVVSCAMDHAVYLHEVAQTSLGRTSSSSSSSSSPCLSIPFFCHTSRVKDVEVEPGNPYNFWSASEDGTVREYDTRSKEGRGPSSQSAATVLLSVGTKQGSPVEIKSLSINPRRAHLIAVGCGDPFVRVYDRRMLTKCPPPSSRSGDYTRGSPIMSLAPAHMICGGGMGRRIAYSTYVHWARRGDRILSNYHSDNIYIFDTSSSGLTSASMSMPPPNTPSSSSSQKQCSIGSGTSLDEIMFPPSPLSLGLTSQGFVRWTGGKRIEDIVKRGDEAILNEDWPSAVRWMEIAAKALPTTPTVHSKLARSLMSRGWLGDDITALQACEWTLALDPCNTDRLLLRTRIRALRSLGQLDSARLGLFLMLGQVNNEEEEEELCRLREEIDRELMQRHKRRGLWLRQREQSMRDRAQVARTMSEGRSTPRPGHSPTGSPPPTTSMGIASSSLIVQMAREASLARGATENHQPVEEEGGEEEEEEEEEEDHQMDLGDNTAEEDPGKEKLLSFYQRLFASNDDKETRQETRTGLMKALKGAKTLCLKGRVNLQTDIKEATFLGQGDKLVGAGSDDGRLFIFCSETGDLVRATPADESILNCVQGHPHLPVLATSGIESLVKLWTTAPEACGEDSETLQEILCENMGSQSHGRGGGLGLTTARLRQALVDSPHLYNLLMSRMVPGGVDESTEEGEGEGRPNLDCRVN